MLKSNFNTEKGNMQYPAGCARRQFVHRWSVFVTPLGTARYRRAVPAPNACAVWSILPTHDHSLGIDTKAPLCKGCCRAISAAGGLSQPTSLHMLVSAQNNPSAPAGHLPLHRGGFFARFRYMHVIARSARPTADACARWAVFVTHEYSLGIVP